MKRASRNLMRWSPVVLRLSLWVFLAMSKTATEILKSVTEAELATWGWAKWVVFTLSVISEGVMVWRLYLDQSLTNHKEKLNEENRVADIAAGEPGRVV